MKKTVLILLCTLLVQVVSSQVVCEKPIFPNWDKKVYKYSGDYIMSPEISSFITDWKNYMACERERKKTDTLGLQTKLTFSLADIRKEVRWDSINLRDISTEDIIKWGKTNLFESIELDQMKEQALGLANQQDPTGSFLFSGYKTKTQPFVKDITGTINYKGDRGLTSLAVSESMVVETNLDGGSLFQNIKVGSNKAISMFTMLENMSNSIRSAAQSVHALEAPTSAEIEIKNKDFGEWKFDITGNGGTANITSELVGDDPTDIITKINNANIGITASLSSNEGKIKLVSDQEGLIKIENLEVPGIENAQKTPSSYIVLNVTDPTGNIMGKSQTLYDTNQLTSSQLNNIAETQVHIANFRGKVGARLNLLDRQRDTLTERDMAIQKDISNLADADLAKLVTEMQSMMTSLQASQQAFVKISNLNLFEFIR